MCVILHSCRAINVILDGANRTLVGINSSDGYILADFAIDGGEEDIIDLHENDILRLKHIFLN